MQAGELISFIEPVNVFSERYEEDDDAEHEAQDCFFALCLELLNSYPENVDTQELLVDVGIETIRETSLSIHARDGSWLHVVASSHQLPFPRLRKVQYRSLDIAIVEYDERGKVRDGYNYTYDAEKFLRTPIQLAKLDEKTGDENPEYGVLAPYRHLDELRLLLASENEEVRKEAEVEYARLQDDASCEIWQEVLGRVPSAEEIEALSGILVLAKPYPHQ